MFLSFEFNTIYLSLFTVDIIIIISGSTFSWSSPVVSKLTNSSTSPFNQQLSLSEISWVSSILGLGAALGPFIFGYLSSKIGKRNTLLVLGPTFLGSHLAMAFGKVVEIFYVSRFIAGLAVGGTFTTSFNYLAEMSNKNNRGVIMAIGSCSVCLGILLSYGLGPYVSIMVLNLTIAILAAIFTVLFTLTGEKCPRYLMSKHDLEKARVVLQKIRGTSNVDVEIEEMKVKEDAECYASAVIDIFKSKGLTKAFAMSTSLFILQQCSGINIVYYYSQTIFEEAGTSLAPEICSIILGVDQFVSSMITSAIIDSVGRKITLIVSCIGVSVSLVPLGVYEQLKYHNIDVSDLSYIPVVSLTIFIFLYNTGIGPVPWIILGEIFPPKVQTPATSIISSFNWILSFLITKYVEFFLHTLGLAWSCWLFSGSCLLFIVIIQFLVIETKQKSLEEIQVILNA